MTANQQTVVAEAVVDKIVARILALLNGEAIDTSARKVLMLFSGASSGFVVGLESIRRLAGSGHPLTVVLSPSAGHIIGQDRVRQAGAGTIIGGGEWVNAPGLVRETDLVLVPTLSMNLAAHLALGLMDSLLTTLIL
ncbi:MAG: flavoprotein, partial [Chloroflexota bacterium]